MTPLLQVSHSTIISWLSNYLQIDVKCSFTNNAPVICNHCPPPPHTHTHTGEGWGIAGLKYGAITFRVSPKCRGNDRVMTLGSLPQGDFLLLRAGQGAKFRTPVRPLGVGVWSGLAQLVAHRTLGRGVPGSILVRGVVCCGLEQVTFPQLNMYTCICIICS